MKICTYCDTTYNIKEIECPSCGASDYRYKCDSCNTIHYSNACPNCGKSTENEPTKACSKCGYLTSERICPKCGYDSMSSSSIKESVASVVAIGACKITGHKWNGCKCTRCGKTRNEGHDYKLVPSKCEEVCSICGDKKELQHVWINGSCTRCSSKMTYFDKKWNSLNDKLPFLNLNKKENRVTFLITLYFVLSITILGIMAFIESTPDSDGNITLPSVMSSLDDKDYKYVVTELEDAGFINIKVIAKEDLVLGWLKTEGEISSITVGGTTEYDTSDRYPVDTEIIIEYHSFPKEDNKDNNDKEDTKDESYIYVGQQYEVVDSYETGIGLTQYWVYTSAFDYSTETYKDKVKEIITDLVRISKTTDIVVEIVSDKEIIHFESNNTIAEYMNKYGDKYYTDTIKPKEIMGYIASYTGGYDPNSSKLSTSDSAYELIWFIASDNPEFEKWKPDLIP